MLEWKDENKQLKEKLKIKTINKELEGVTFQPKINKKSTNIVKNIKNKINSNDSNVSSNVSILNTNRSTNSASTNRSNKSEEGHKFSIKSIEFKHTHNLNPNDKLCRVKTPENYPLKNANK